MTDTNGCMATDSVLISVPDSITLIINSIDAICGLSNGEVSVSVSGGTGAYTFLWDDPGSSVTDTITGLPAATYNVTVTDANGCTQTASVIINDMGSVSVSAIIDSNVSCNGSCDGQVTVSLTGGVAPFTYLWNDPGSQTNSSATGLCAGTIIVTVTDSNSCLTIDSVTITEPLILSIVIADSIELSCNGDSDV